MAAKAQTISMSRGKTAIEHDLREYSPHNVDASMTQYNRVLINELNGRSLEQYTNEMMKPYIDEYNAKQRRSDRMKGYDYVADYMQEQVNRATKQQHYTAGSIAYEYVIQFGDHESMDVNEVVADKELYNELVEMYQEFIQSYQSSYPHVKIVLATLHMDEPNGTPHMHLLVQPIGEGYKQGLSHQISLTKALACDGFERSEKRGDRLSLSRWQDDVKDRIMEPILLKRGYVRAYRDGETHHMTVSQYKNAMGEKDKIIEAAEQKAEEIVDEAYEKLFEIEDEKEKIIQGATGEARTDMPYEEWPMEDLKAEREILIGGYEFGRDEEKLSLEELSRKRAKIEKDYKIYVNGYDREDGTHIMSYKELVEQHKRLMEEPETILETEAGRAVIEAEKKNIVQEVKNYFVSQMFGYVKKRILEQIKEYILEPIFEAVDNMLYEHHLRMNDADRRAIKSAVERSVDVVADIFCIGDQIENDLKEHVPRDQEVEEVVARQIRKRGR